jgi:cobalt-zinc-cadmium efflux system membrane fusion protein
MKESQTRLLPKAALLLLVLTLGVVVGRQSVGGSVSDAPEETHEEGQEEEHEEHAREGQIVFSPESLKLAQLKVEPIEVRPVETDLRVTGTVEPNPDQVSKVTSPVTGKVQTIAVNVGDNVAAGQVLATLGSSELTRAHAEFIQAKAQTPVADSRFKRARLLLKDELISRQEWEQAQAEQAQARAGLQAARMQLELFGGSEKEPVVRVTAPLSGRITERLLTVGEVVSAERPLFTIVDLSLVWVQLTVSLKDLPVVRMGERVMIVSEAAPEKRFSGRVSYVGDVADETNQAVKVRAVITNEGELLKPGAFVRGAITIGPAKEALAVPKAAVQDYQGETVVFVAGEAARAFEPREIIVGETLGEKTLITAGLKPGERVVTEGAFLVKAEGLKHQLGHDDD